MPTSAEEPDPAERGTRHAPAVTLQLTPKTYDHLMRAAEIVEESIEKFIQGAAVDRADAVMRDEQVTRTEHVTIVPSGYFDELVAALDEPDEPCEALQRAARRLREHVTIVDEPVALVTQSEHMTIVPSDVFDELLDDDTPDEPNERLQRAIRDLPNVVRWTD